MASKIIILIRDIDGVWKSVPKALEANDSRFESRDLLTQLGKAPAFEPRLSLIWAVTLWKKKYICSVEVRYNFQKIKTPQRYI